MQDKLDLYKLTPVERTKYLLLNYRKLSRAIAFDLDQIRESYGLYGRLEDIVDRYADGETIWISPSIEDRIRKINETKILITNLLNAVEACKNYYITMADRACITSLNRGALYYTILVDSYFSDTPLTPESLIAKIEQEFGFGLSNATYWRYKKDAIKYVSDILWCIDGLDFKTA